MSERETRTSARPCELQARLGIEETCSKNCLYFERDGTRVVGCLYENTDVSVMPKSIARQLLHAAGRRSR